MLNVLGWACLAPRPQNRLAEPRSATGYKAPPTAASALSTKRQGTWSYVQTRRGGWVLQNSDLALPEGSIAK